MCGLPVVVVVVVVVVCGCCGYPSRHATHTRCAVREERALKTTDQWEMSAVHAMEKVQDVKAKEMVRCMCVRVGCVSRAS